MLRLAAQCCHIYKHFKESVFYCAGQSLYPAQRQNVMY